MRRCLTLFTLLAILCVLTAAPSPNRADQTLNCARPQGDSSNAPAAQTNDGCFYLNGHALFADDTLPLPLSSACLVWTTRILPPSAIAALSAAGLRYLDYAGQHAYVFLRIGGDEDLIRSELRCIGAADGSTSLNDEHRIYGTLGQRLATATDDEWLTVDITFWRGTLWGEIADLLPSGASPGVEGPGDPNGELGDSNTVRCSMHAADVRRLAAHPFTATIASYETPIEMLAEIRTRNGIDNVYNTAPYNLDGTGIVMGLWDVRAVDVAHPALASRVTRVETSPVDTAATGHSTHVCGIMAGDGTGSASSRGVAPKARIINYTFATNNPEWDEQRACKHTNYQVVDNHSYGNPPATYNTAAYTYDMSARWWLLTSFVAVGNYGTLGYNTLSPDVLNRNMIAVGCADEDGQTVRDSSSRGPAPGGGIKPDLVAVGSSVDSCMPGGTYGVKSGTSMSSPAVAGMAGLLQQLALREYGMRLPSDTMRAVFIQTATEVSDPGPDYISGWGLVRVDRAADLVLADRQSGGKRLIRGAVRENANVSWPLTVAGGDPELRVTLCWIDVAASGQAALIHDLDLELVDPSGAIRLPYTLNPATPTAPATTGVNTKDTVEQIRIANPAAGTWTVRVKGTSITDTTHPVQGFVLASSHDVGRPAQTVVDAQSVAAGRAVPDNSASGLDIPLAVTAAGSVRAVRVFLDVTHTAKGDLKISLTSQAGTSLVLRNAAANTADDFFVIFPDTYSAGGDITTFAGESAAGTWTLNVTDTIATNTGTVRLAAIEVETDTNGGGPVPVLTTITVTPNPVALAPGATQQFTATGYDQFGAVMVISPAPTWSVSAGGGSIGANGLLTASMTLGVYTVTATSGAIQGTASVTVSSTPVISTITIAPDPATATAGETRQFTAVGRDQFGNVMAFTPTWTATGGTIDINGLYTAGLTTGAFSVTATEAVTGVQDIAAVTISTGGGTPPGPTGGGGCTAIAGQDPRSLWLLLGLGGVGFIAGFRRSSDQRRRTAVAS